MAFQKGKSGNPEGRPKGSPNRTTKELRQLIREVVDWEDFFCTLASQAKEGNLQASKLILLYGYGVPKDMSDIEGYEDYVRRNPIDALLQDNPIL